MRSDAKPERAKNPEATAEAVRRAFSRLGGTGYRAGKVMVSDPLGLFVPASVMNGLRRSLVAALDAERSRQRSGKADEAARDDGTGDGVFPARRRVKIRLGQKVPPGSWDEVIVSIAAGDPGAIRGALPSAEALGGASLRLALPLYTAEPDFAALRATANRLMHAGFRAWECSGLATLRMLRSLGAGDVTADWTLYAFNARALAELSDAGVKRFTASPENSGENLRRLAESGYDVEFLVQQSTPLFVSLTKPGAGVEPAIPGLAVFRRDGLWVTTRPVPRTFEAPDGASVRTDLSWDPFT